MEVTIQQILSEHLIVIQGTGKIRTNQIDRALPSGSLSQNGVPESGKSRGAGGGGRTLKPKAMIASTVILATVNLN